MGETVRRQTTEVVAKLYEGKLRLERTSIAVEDLHPEPLGPECDPPPDVAHA